MFPEASGWAILSIMLGDCLNKISSEIGGRVAPPRNEDLGSVQNWVVTQPRDTRKSKVATSYTSCREHFHGIIFK